MHHFLDHRKSNMSRSMQHNAGYQCQCKYAKICNDDGRRADMGDKKKGPAAQEGKGVKLCHVHGKRTNHTYRECRANPHNQVGSKPCASNNNNNKCTHNNHHHDSHYASSDKESRGSAYSPMLSNDEANTSGSSKAINKNYHISVDGKVQKKAKVGRCYVLLLQEQSHQVTKKVLDDHLDWDEVFGDAYLIGLEIADADLKTGIQMENPFAFGNWWPMLVKPRKCATSSDCLEHVLYKLGLHHSKLLSSLAETDFHSTNLNLDSTRNAPTILNALSIHHIYADDVYAISEVDDSVKKMDKPRKVVPKNLTPVTIMVLETISSVKSRILLKVLLDSGSTTTMINRKC